MIDDGAARRAYDRHPKRWAKAAAAYAAETGCEMTAARLQAYCAMHRMKPRATMPAAPPVRVEDHMRLAWRIANRYARRTPHLRDDLEGAAMLGLCLAARRNRPADPSAWGRYAALWIERECRDVIASDHPIRFPRGRRSPRPGLTRDPIVLAEITDFRGGAA